MSFPHKISSACSREIRYKDRLIAGLSSLPSQRSVHRFLIYMRVARAYFNNYAWRLPSRSSSNVHARSLFRHTLYTNARSGPFHYRGEGCPDVVFQHGGVSIWLSPVVLYLNRLWRPYATGRGRVSRYRRYFSLRADNEKHDRHQAPVERDSCAIEQQVGPAIDSRSVNRIRSSDL